MGVDVNLYAVGSPTEVELSAADAFLRDRCRSFVDDYDEKGVVIRLVDWGHGPRYEVKTMSRYYGPWYERGDWPQIYAAIRALRATLPMCTVHYGGDSDDEAPEATDEYLAAIWEHWLGPCGDSYHEHLCANQARFEAERHTR